MSIAQILAEDLIRAVVVNGDGSPPLREVESVENLKIIEAVTRINPASLTGTDEITDPAYLSVTITDTEYRRFEVVWYVTLSEAIAYLAKDVVVTF